MSDDTLIQDLRRLQAAGRTTLIRAIACDAGDEIESLRAEVERLQAEREALKVQANVLRREKDSACEERDTIIERCAEVCDSMRGAGSFECAAAIRAMKNDPVA